jgi:Thioredoxin domain-containing protein
MGNKNSFYFRPRHFLSAIVVFYILTRVIAGIHVTHEPISETKASTLTELTEVNLQKEGIRLIFFYRNDSGLCGKMRYNIEQLAGKIPDDVGIYAMDIEEHPEYYYKYNVSGVPNIVIFKGDKEIKRVMGVVSTANLERIVKKITTPT